MRMLGCCTASEHNAIHDKIHHLLTVNPTELLDHDHSLLMIDFDALGSGPTENRQIWCASMNTALAAAEHPIVNNYIDSPSL